MSGMCPTCGPTDTEQHPRQVDVTRCANCKEWLSRPDPTLDTEAGFRAAVVRAAQQRAAFTVMGVRFVPEPVPGDDLPEEWVTLIESLLPWLLPALMKRERVRIMRNMLNG